MCGKCCKRGLCVYVSVHIWPRVESVCVLSSVRSKMFLPSWFMLPQFVLHIPIGNIVFLHFAAYIIIIPVIPGLGACITHAQVKREQIESPQRIPLTLQTKDGLNFSCVPCTSLATLKLSHLTE